MLGREIIAVCSDSNKQHVNALCGLNTKFLMLNLVINYVTTGPQMMNTQTVTYFLNEDKKCTVCESASLLTCNKKIRY
jgi:hypothetical protein